MSYVSTNQHSIIDAFIQFSAYLSLCAIALICRYSQVPVSIGCVSIRSQAYANSDENASY